MPTKPRILLSINASWNIYNFRRSLIQRFQEEGFEVLTAAPEDAYSDKLRAMTDYHPLPMSNAGTSPWHDFMLFCRYLKLLYAVKPDVFLGYTVKPNVYGTLAAACLGIPVINNVSGLGTVFIKHNWVTRLVKALYRFAFRFSDHVFFQNEEDQQLFVEQQLVAAEKTSVIPGSGIDLQHYQPRPAPEHDAPHFILIARMLWDKGIGEYVEAARRVKERHPQAKFRLLGPIGVENKTAIPQHTIEQWQREGAIDYLGETDDVREALTSHDAVVLPSYREGMSRVLIEGLAMGRPLIASNVPGCKHTIDKGQNGLLCDVKNAEDLAAKLLEFIALPEATRQEMGAASRRKAEAEFDQDIVLNAYLRKVRSLLPARPTA